MVPSVTCAARHHPTFPFHLVECLAEGQNRVRRRSVTELAILLKALKLTQKVQAQTPSIALASNELLPPAKNEGKARNSLNAFVGRGNQEVNAASLEVDWDCPETAHRIHDVDLSVFPGNAPDRLEGIEDASGRFAMDHGNVRHIPILGEQFVESDGVHRLVFGRAQNRVSDPGVPEHFHNSFAICAVGEHRNLAIRLNASLEYCFNSERATALQEYCLPSTFPRDTRQF